MVAQSNPQPPSPAHSSNSTLARHGVADDWRERRAIRWACYRQRVTHLRHAASKALEFYRAAGEVSDPTRAQLRRIADLWAAIARRLLETLEFTGPPVTPRHERPRCGARCRDGHSCLAPAVWNEALDWPRNGRCKMHGGASTGPRTPEGRAVASELARKLAGRRWRKPENETGGATTMDTPTPPRQEARTMGAP